MNGALSRVEGASGPGYLATTYMKVIIVSAGEHIDMQMTQGLEFDAQPPYRLRRAHMLQSQGNGRQETTLVRTPKGFTVTTTTKGDKDTKQIAPMDFTLADVLASYVWLRGRPKAGAVFRSQDLDLD